MQTTFDNWDHTSLRREEQVEDRFVSSFGMSSEQFRHELEAEFEQASPKERAEFERLVDEANAILPEMHASVERIGEHINLTTSTMGDLKAAFALLEARLGKIEDTLVTGSTAKPSLVGKGKE